MPALVAVVSCCFCHYRCSLSLVAVSVILAGRCRLLPFLLCSLVAVVVLPFLSFSLVAVVSCCFCHSRCSLLLVKASAILAGRCRSLPFLLCSLVVVAVLPFLSFSLVAVASCRFCHSR